MGFKLMENFKRPYFAQSIGEFWSKWHISLSTWFRDYVYIPLGGNRVKKARLYFNLFVVFIISGLWHGANWTFIVWGTLHGIYLVTGVISKTWRQSLMQKLGLHNTYVSKALNIISTFLLVTLAWIFFRANSLSEAWGIINRVFVFKSGFFIGEPSYFVYDFMAIFALLFYELKQEYGSPNIKFLTSEKLAVRMGSYALLIFFILLFGVFDGGQFIYFQF